MIDFVKHVHHDPTRGSCVEVWEDGFLLGVIYGGQPGHISIVSKYLSGEIEFEPPEPVATVKMKFIVPKN